MIGISFAKYVEKFSKGFDLIFDGRFNELVAAMSNLYQSKLSGYEGGFQRTVSVPIYLLEEIHLLVDEGSLAYPLRDGGWQIIKLSNLSLGRQIPIITRSVIDTRHGSPKHTKLMEDIYSFDGFVTVKKNDIIVDVGAYIGTLAFCFAEKSGIFISIDPMASVSNHLKYNTQSYPNVITVPKAAWTKKTELEINQSSLPNENSVLGPDQRDSNSSFSVDADTVPNIVKNLGIEHVDYLKIEAEGVEIEILEAALADEIEIEKIAVDASAERDGSDVIDEVGAIFESYNYDWRINEEAPEWGSEIVFAKEESSK
jgi:FkbM family methyltransferase